MLNKEIIQAAYGQLKKASLSNLQPIIDELELLGIEHSEQDVILAFQLVEQSESLKDALERGTQLTDSSREEALSAAQNQMEIAKQEEAEFKRQQERDRKEQAASLEQAELSNVNSRICDYTVVAAKTQAVLIQGVKAAMADGWIPFGGVSAAAFGVSPVAGNQYIQALVKYRTAESQKIHSNF
ncbi:MAG: hypothetical protein P8M73_06070 [Luminiphilus sp.]|nr:hypothetical protein [Luminiphilus sp.]